MQCESTAVSAEGRDEARGAPMARCVYVIDDDADVRKSLHFLLGVSSITAWAFATARDFLDQLPTLSAAPILLDLRMPGMGGFELLRVLKDRDVFWPVIVMTAHAEIPIAVEAMRSGALEFLEKPFPPNVLERALASSFQALDRSQAQVARRDDARSRIGLLSPREREIILMLLNGATNKQVAGTVGIGVRTVEMHRLNAFAKLAVRNIPELMVLWMASDYPGLRKE